MRGVRTSTPYTVVAGAEPTVEAPKRELLRVTRRLEAELRAHPPAAVGATLQDARYLTDTTRAVYVGLAAQGARVRLFARSLHAWLGPGVEGVCLDDGDPLVDEWCIVVPGDRPVAFAGTDLRYDDAADADRGFRYAVSRDPEVVRACASALGLPTDEL